MDKKGKIFNIVGSFFRKENEMPKNGKLIRIEITNEKGDIIQTKQYTSGEKFDFEKINVVAIIEPEENPGKEERYLIDPRFYEISHYNPSDTKNPIPFDIYTDTYEVKDNEGTRQLIQRFKYTYKSDIPTTAENELQEASCELVLTIVPQIIKIENIKVMLKDSNKKYYRNESFTSADIKQVLGEYSYYREDYGAEGERKTIEIFECKNDSAGQSSTNKRCYIIQNGNNLQPNEQGKATVYVEYRGIKKETSPEDKFVVAIELNVYKEEKIPELIVTFKNNIKRLYYDGENLDVGGNSPELSKIKIEKKYPHQENKLIDLTKELPYYKKGNSNLIMKIGEKIIVPPTSSDNSISIPVLDEYGMYTDGSDNGYFKLEFEYTEIDNSGNKYRVTWSSINEDDIKKSNFLAQVYKVNDALDIEYNNGYVEQSKINIPINKKISEVIKKVKIHYSHCIRGIEEKVLNTDEFQLKINDEFSSEEKELFQSQLGDWICIKRGTFSKGLFKIIYNNIDSPEENDFITEPLLGGEITIETTPLELTDYFGAEKGEYYFKSKEFHYNSQTDQQSSDSNILNNKLGVQIFKQPQYKLFTNVNTFKKGIDRIEIWDGDDAEGNFFEPIITLTKENANKNLYLDRGNYKIKVILINNKDKEKYEWVKNKIPIKSPNAYETNVKIKQECTAFESDSYYVNVSKESSDLTRKEEDDTLSITMKAKGNKEFQSDAESLKDFNKVFIIDKTGVDSNFIKVILNSSIKISFDKDVLMQENPNSISSASVSANAQISINKGIQKYNYFSFPNSLSGYTVTFFGNLTFKVTIEKPIRDFWAQSFDLPTAISSVRQGIQEEKDLFKTYRGSALEANGIPCYLIGYSGNTLYFMYVSQYDVPLIKVMGTKIGEAGDKLFFTNTNSDNSVIDSLSSYNILSDLRQLRYKNFSNGQQFAYKASLRVWVPTAEELDMGQNNIIPSGKSSIPNLYNINSVLNNMSSFSNCWLSNCYSKGKICEYEFGKNVFCIIAMKSGNSVAMPAVWCDKTGHLSNLNSPTLLVKCFKINI